MEVPNKMNPLAWLRKHLDDEGSSDVVREMVKTFAEALMSAEADAVCGAGWGERSPERTNRRKRLPKPGLRHPGGQDRPGDPKLRSGSYFPDWLLEPRRRAERALVAVVAQCYLEAVSTPRVEDVARMLGIERLSKSQVSDMANTLDAMVEAFRSRPLDAGPYTYVWVDALVQRVREDGRVQNVAVVLATGVNASGQREVLGVDVITAEDGAGWTAFLRGLVAGGLSGVQLVVSDAHEGLKAGSAAVLDGASWQRSSVNIASGDGPAGHLHRRERTLAA